MGDQDGQNASAPVNRLPPEILSRILECRTAERVLVIATHVCRHWRCALISSPSLWTSFESKSSHPDRALTYLTRSKSVPIDTRADLDSPRDLEVFGYLTPHIARTRSLIIQGNHTEVCAASLLLRTSSPILQHLEIRARSGVARLPDDFLGRHAPSLRFVTFDGIHPALEPHFPLPSLIEFSISLPKGAGPFRVGALFRLLSGCPWLQKIQINSEEPSQGITLGQIISLESLVDRFTGAVRLAEFFPA